MSEQIAAFRADRDAFGHLLLDRLNGLPAVEIIEREDRLVLSGDTPRYFSEYAEWDPMEQEAMRWVLPGRALDLGCGAGRMALYLQEQGHEVMRVDVSPLAVEVCRRRGVKEARQLSITQVGAGLGVFDNLLMMGNNWGPGTRAVGGGSRRRARWLLRRFHTLTPPSARIIAASRDIYQADAPYHRAYLSLNRERGRMAGQIRMRVRYLVYCSEWFDYLMVSREEMRSIVDGTGWRVLRYLDSPGAAYAGVLEKVG
jgi:SAM-dependent methyltransferase